MSRLIDQPCELRFLRHAMPSCKDDFLHLMAEAAVPGAAIAVVRNGRLDHYVNCGIRGVQMPEPVDENTVFDAASLSKPVFAHLVLQLVDRGDLRLEDRLDDYLPNYIPTDSRSRSITINDVLSHSSGLPNWRNADYPLRTYFPPGERFSYSGDGYFYLQEVVEAVTGEKLDCLAQRLVFEPLAMTRSSFVWQPRFDENRAYPHDAFGTPALGGKPGIANVAGSLQTCAADFARFLLAVLDGSRLRPESARRWLRPRVEVKHRGVECLGPSAEDLVTHVAWGLGWGLETDADMFFHWGDNGPFTAFTTGSLQERTAFVVFTNGASGHSIMPELVANIMPGVRASLTWLDYVRHDSPVRRMLRAALTNGVEAAWAEIQSAALDPGELRWIAQGLNARGRQQDSVWLSAQVEAQERPR